MKGQRGLCAVGERHGLLTIQRRWTEKTGPNRGKEVFCECLCDCGQTVVVRGRYLRSTKIRKGLIVPSPTQSCGCLRKRCNKEHHAWKGHGDISSSVWSAIKNSAKRKSREIDFSITIEQAWKLFQDQQGKCALSGQPIGFSTRNRRYEGIKNSTASLDRIDSTKAYTVDNVQWVHKIINIMKWHLSQDEFIAWCKQVTLNCTKEKT